MNLVKKILVVHGEAKARRRLVLMLADRGYDLRAFGSAEAALDSSRTEWFDLAIVSEGVDHGGGFAFAESLKRTQPTVPVFLLAAFLELPTVVRGIRAGLADVLADEADPRTLLRRVHARLRPGLPESGEELTAGELAEVENLLARLNEGETAPAAEGTDADLRQELVRATHERAALEHRIERLVHEKAAVEAELRTILAQTSDAQRMKTELADLQTQRELAAASQAAIDAKAEQLRALRAEIDRERGALDAARRDAAGLRSLEAEKASLEAMRDELRSEQDRLRDEAARLRQEAAQVAQERRRWHEDLDLLAAQEDNLRAYEERLRLVQAQLESERVHWNQERREPSRSPFRDDADLRAAWEKLQRATELLEADKAVLRDERMALRDHEAALKRREAGLKELEAKQVELDRRLRALPPPPPPPSVTRSPFAIFNKAKN